MKLKDIVLHKHPLGIPSECIKVTTTRNSWSLCIFNRVPVINRSYDALYQTSGWCVEPRIGNLAYYAYNVWYSIDMEQANRSLEGRK